MKCNIEIRKSKLIDENWSPGKWNFSYACIILQICIGRIHYNIIVYIVYVKHVENKDCVDGIYKKSYSNIFYNIYFKIIIKILKSVKVLTARFTISFILFNKYKIYLLSYNYIIFNYNEI